MNEHKATVALAASHLGDLVQELVLVGGCATGFLVTEPEAVDFRSTKDVDVVTTVAKTSEYHKVEKRLRDLGFNHVREKYPRFQKESIVLDLMPDRETAVGGSVNRWYREGVKLSSEMPVIKGVQMRIIHPALFLATKLEAFNNRGNGDFSASQDMEDIITVINGREEVTGDIEEISEFARNFITHEIETLVGEPTFLDSIAGMIKPDEASQQRLPVITERLMIIAGI